MMQRRGCHIVSCLFGHFLRHGITLIVTVSSTFALSLAGGKDYNGAKKEETQYNILFHFRY